MRLTVNGDERELAVAGDLSVARLLDELGVPPRFGAVEVNREVVPRSEHGTRLLADGDVVEIIRFVGGG